MKRLVVGGGVRRGVCITDHDWTVPNTQSGEAS